MMTDGEYWKGQADLARRDAERLADALGELEIAARLHSNDKRELYRLCAKAQGALNAHKSVVPK